MKLVMVVVTACLLVFGDGAARADAARDAQARQLYKAGRDAYNAGDFQRAYDSFRESFTLSHEPALLYNIASALQGLKRPHDAAEALQSYLRLKADDPDRPQIEERIRTLEEEQRLLDLERKPTPPTPPAGPTTVTEPPSPNGATSLTASAAPSSREKERMHKRTALIVGLTAGAIKPRPAAPAASAPASFSASDRRPAPATCPTWRCRRPTAVRRRPTSC
jgi:tetratricopeptide (TPR) repeat protein